MSSGSTRASSSTLRLRSASVSVAENTARSVFSPDSASLKKFSSVCSDSPCELRSVTSFSSALRTASAVLLTSRLRWRSTSAARSLPSSSKSCPWYPRASSSGTSCAPHELHSPVDSENVPHELHTNIPALSLVTSGSSRLDEGSLPRITFDGARAPPPTH